MSLAPGSNCPECNGVLVDSDDLGRCPACRWREFAPAD
jgi:hypothetical protein